MSESAAERRVLLDAQLVVARERLAIAKQERAETLAVVRRLYAQHALPLHEPVSSDHCDTCRDWFGYDAQGRPRHADDDS
ncbi:MAG TPA: hypothetical protein VFH54_19410 [Mycobacteriales bacterium]|nr:hypothetical protein [Mycobacteriales bacterium]